MKLVFATRNAGKLREARAILGPRVELLSAEDATLPEVEESGGTFEENAILKAKSAADASGLPALADDSGLEVDALDRRPGVRSARYGGPGLDDRGRVALLLKELAGVPAGKRTARFVCAIAFAEPGGLARVTRATVEGRIAFEPSGDGGFGYDPVFVPDGFDQSFGLLPSETKNRLSHRAKALTAARAWLD